MIFVDGNEFRREEIFNLEPERREFDHELKR